MLDIFQNLFAPPRQMLLLIGAAWIGLSLAERRANTHGIKKEDLNNLIFYGFLTYILGGRVSFILQNIQSFIKSPAGIVSINPGLFDPFGAFATALIVILVYLQRKQLSFWPCLDALTPFIAVLTIGLGLSHLAAGTAFGIQTDLPWAIDLWNAKRHPTQEYEIIASTLTFGLIWVQGRRSIPGILFLTYAVLTAGWQLFLLAFRANNRYILNGLNQSQIIAWISLAVCFMVIEYRIRKTKNG